MGTRWPVDGARRGLNGTVDGIHVALYVVGVAMDTKDVYDVCSAGADVVPKKYPLSKMAVNHM